MSDMNEDIKAAMAQASGGAPENEDRSDIAADIAAAMGAQEPEEVAEVTTEEAPVEEVKAEEAPDVTAKDAPVEEPAKPEEGVKLDPARAPSSWSAKVREKWQGIDPEVRSEILRREESHVNGVRKLQEEHEPVKRFVESIGGVLHEASTLGVPPAQYIHNLAQAEHALRNGPPESRFEALMSLADQYGLPLRQYLNIPGQQQEKAAALPPEIMRELEEGRRFREQYSQQTRQTEQERIQQEIASFEKENEFFNDVRELMADLMDTNPRRTLKDAYEQAIWAHPEVRQVLIQRQQQAAAQDSSKQRRAAAAGASVQSNSRSDLDVPGDPKEDTLEDTIRNVYAASVTRRV